MIEAILALVGVIAGGVFGIIQGGKASYAQKQAEYQANKDFARNKELSVYGIYGTQQQTKTILIVIGVIGIIVMIYFLKNRK